METEISTFKGKSILSIKRSSDDKYPFSFGVQKAKLILGNVEAIKNFVADSERAHAEEERSLI